jgi:hypothetical protein
MGRRGGLTAHTGVTDGNEGRRRGVQLYRVALDGVDPQAGEDALDTCDIGVWGQLLCSPGM